MFQIGTEVAVLPKAGGDVITIDTIEHVDRNFVRLKGGGIFLLNGESLSKPGSVFIVPATEDHHSSISRRRPR